MRVTNPKSLALNHFLSAGSLGAARGGPVSLKLPQTGLLLRNLRKFTYHQETP